MPANKLDKSCLVSYKPQRVMIIFPLESPVVPKVRVGYDGALSCFLANEAKSCALAQVQPGCCLFFLDFS
jgi:hypothetical protein